MRHPPADRAWARTGPPPLRRLPGGGQAPLTVALSIVAIDGGRDGSGWDTYDTLADCSTTA